MKIDAYSLVDFQKENGLFYHIYAIKTKGWLFDHYYKLTLESYSPTTLPEELFEAITEEKIKLNRISRKGKEMSLGRLFFAKYSHKDMKYYGTEYKWDECYNVAIVVQSGYIEEHLRLPL